MTGQAKHGAVFFDRDGILNEDVGYLYRPEDFRWVTGARAALRAVIEAGLHAIVVTNQSGVARGYYSEADVVALHDWMRDDLARDGIAITAFYFCPFHACSVTVRYRHPNHPDRKPNPGMILRGIRECRIDPARSLIVGDKESDIEAGRRAGIRGLLYEGGDLCEWLTPSLTALSHHYRFGKSSRLS